MKQFLATLSFRNKILTIVVLITVCPGILSYFQIQNGLKINYEEGLKTISSYKNILEDNFTRNLETQYEQALLMAHNQTLNSDSLSDVTQTLNSYVQDDHYLELLILADRNGNVIATNTIDHSNKYIDTKKIQKLNLKKFSWFN